MSILREFERKIEERLQRMLAPQAGTGASAQGREVIEIHRGILDDAARHVSTLQRGKKAFPYNRMHVQVAVPDETRKPVFQMALADGDQLLNDVREMLRQSGAEAPADLALDVELLPETTPETASRGFFVAYRLEKAPVTTAVATLADAPPSRTGKLEVLAGEAVPAALELAKQRTNLGRLADLLDDRQRLVRRNDLAFAEGEGINATVSRAHAYLVRDAASGEYRIFDEASAYGTAVLRDGRLIPVTARGVGLRNGDEIYLGQARIRFEQ